MPTSAKASSTSSLSSARRTITKWRKNPAKYVTDVFGATPEPWQAAALQDLADHGKVSVRSGHGVGKTALLAWSVLWFMQCHFPARVPCTAPSAAQLNDVLWSELGTWLRRMDPELRKQFDLKSDRLEMVSAPAESFAVARTARKEAPEALQGFHSENLLYIVDEASGVPDEVFHVAQGALTSKGSKVMLTSNPTRLSGFFHASHTKVRHRWATHRVPCSESTQVSPEYIEDMAEQYGTDSSIYAVRVLGEFPSADDDTVIPLDLLESAIGREVAPSSGSRVVWGLDVARFGSDATALAKRQGRVLLEPVSVRHGQDLMQTAGWVLDQYLHAPLRPDSILVDSIGLGAGVVDRLRELGAPVMGVNVAERPSSKERYMRLRDELWFAAREWLEQRDCAIPDDQRLIAELSLPRYHFESNGKIRVESKDDMKRRGVKSPDRADAFCLTFGLSDLPRPASWNRPLKYDNRGII